MSYRSISLLVPTRRRPRYLRNFLDSYYATASAKNDSEIVFRVDFDDLESLLILAEHDWPVIVGPRRNGYKSLPSFYNQMARLATGDILVCCNDDVVIETPGWAQLVIEAANCYSDGIFNIGVSTELNDDFFPFSIVSRKLVDRLGFINDERLVFSDMFLLDIAKYFGRVRRLPSVKFRHNWAGENPAGIDVTRDDARRVEFEFVFADSSGGWSDKYRALHETAVAEAVARVDPDNEILAGQALLEFERYQPGPTRSDAHWPPSVPPLPWSAPRGGSGIHYHRGEMFELLKAITKRRLRRRRILLTAFDNGLPALLWGNLYEHVVSLHEAGQQKAIQEGKYRLEFGPLLNTTFMYGLLDKIGEVDTLVLDSSLYERLISPYFMLRRAMPRPSLIVVMNTAAAADASGGVHARRFIDDLALGHLDGTLHSFTHIEFPGGNGISYEFVE